MARLCGRVELREEAKVVSIPRCLREHLKISCWALLFKSFTPPYRTMQGSYCDHRLSGTLKIQSIQHTQAKQKSATGRFTKPLPSEYNNQILFAFTLCHRSLKYRHNSESWSSYLETYDKTKLKSHHAEGLEWTEGDAQP